MHQSKRFFRNSSFLIGIVCIGAIGLLLIMGFMAVSKKIRPLDKKYNVLFIAVDDLNTDLSIYSHSLMKTPNFQRLAKMGVKFNKAYTQYPWCNPSRVSILTGLNPDDTHIYDLTTPVRKTMPAVITLPQLFRNNGYYSARVGKIFHYGVPGDIGTNGLDDSISWDERINPIGIDRTEEYNITNLLPKRGWGSTLAYWAAPGKDDQETDGKVANEAIRLLKQNKNRPFFIAVGFFRPHSPFVAPKKYFNMYPLDKIKLSPTLSNDFDDIPKAAFWNKVPNWGLDKEKQKEAIRAYYASISFIDAQLGKILDEVDRLSLRNNTIIVLWSDHGYNLGQHGQWMKQSLFENALRVPLIISVPNGLKGKSVDNPVELVDIYPTLADLCNLPTPNGQVLSGKSLKPLLFNLKTVGNDVAFSQVKRGKIMGYSVRTKKWRYTEWDQGRRGRELYDEQNDKNEFFNLASKPEYKKVVQHLSSLLKRYSSDYYYCHK